MTRLRFLPWLAFALLPTPGAAVVAVVGLLFGLVFLLAALALSLGGDGGVVEAVQGFGILGGMVVVGVMVTQLVAMVLTGSRPSRGVFSASLSGLWLYGAASFGLAFGVDEGLFGAVVAVILFMGPVLLVAVIPIAVGLVSSVRAVRTGWLEARRELIRDWLSRKGWARIEDLSDAVGASREQVLEDAGASVVTGKLVWREERLRKLREKALGMVGARGRVHVRDLGRELRLRPEASRELVHHVVGEGLLTGWIDWDAGVLHSEEAAALREQGHCPRCGGELRLEGRGVIGCRHCGSEIFL